MTLTAVILSVQTAVQTKQWSSGMPWWIVGLAGYCSVVSSLIIVACVVLHCLNYRKPFEQRLMIRIQMIVPLFALSCFTTLVNQKSSWVIFVLEPLREVYEAFVIYTFFSLLTHMLGGERNIIIVASGRKPVSHPGVLGMLLPDLDISDPHTFLGIKRGILQYVWLKPLICACTILADVLGLYDSTNMGATSVYLWLTVMYNLSVTTSLYCLAIFWKILWSDLKPFDPISKFLCVKLIIFASYWQGIALAILNAFHVLPGSDDINMGKSIQNSLLCVELIGFAVGHWIAFSYKPFTVANIPYSRLTFWHAVKDVAGCKDLVHDFKVTFYGDYYRNYKQFNSVEALISHPESRGRIARIKQGLRYHADGKQKFWLPSQAASSNASILSTSEHNALNPHLEPSYPPSIKSNGTSTRGIFSSSPRYFPLGDAAISEMDINDSQSITEILNTDTTSYDIEQLDDDEPLYLQAYSVINNYNLDQDQVKRILNYPVVDDIVDGHIHKVRQRNELLRGHKDRYGTI